MHTKLKAFILAALLAGTTGFTALPTAMAADSAYTQTGLTGTATENGFLVIRAANYKGTNLTVTVDGKQVAEMGGVNYGVHGDTLTIPVSAGSSWKIEGSGVERMLRGNPVYFATGGMSTEERIRDRFLHHRR